VIACIGLSNDNSSHFVFFCLGTSPIENRLPVDMMSLGLGLGTRLFVNFSKCLLSIWAKISKIL